MRRPSDRFSRDPSRSARSPRQHLYVYLATSYTELDRTPASPPSPPAPRSMLAQRQATSRQGTGKKNKATDSSRPAPPPAGRLRLASGSGGWGRLGQPRSWWSWLCSNTAKKWGGMLHVTSNQLLVASRKGCRPRSGPIWANTVLSTEY